MSRRLLLFTLASLLYAETPIGVKLRLDHRLLEEDDDDTIDVIICITQTFGKCSNERKLGKEQEKNCTSRCVVDGVLTQVRKNI
jgi:hypothetical protein